MPEKNHVSSTLLSNKAQSRAKSTVSILSSYTTVDRSGLHIFFTELKKDKCYKPVTDINLYVNDMGEHLLVCAVKGLEIGRFNEMLLLLIFI